MAERTAARYVEQARLFAVLLVDIGTDPPIYLHNGMGGLFLQGKTYSGVGDLGSVSAIREAAGTQGFDFQLGLTRANTELVSAALDTELNGAAVSIKLATSNDGIEWLDADVVVIKRGRISHATMEATGITLSCNTPMTDLTSPATYAQLYTDDHQRAKHPGDFIFRLVAELEEKEILF